MSHAKREHKKHNPVHVTTKVLDDVANLRGGELGPEIGRYFRRVVGRHARFRVTVFSIQTTHLHMIVEADSQDALSRGLQGLLSGLARLINRHTGRSGKVWRDRYHAHELTTPTETRHAARYVLLNRAHHGGPVGIDPLSSATWYAHWREVPPATTGSPVAEPRTWLLQTGAYAKLGPLSLGEGPSRH